MPDLIKDSERVMADARAVLRDNQAGGRHRQVAKGPAIGEGSRRLRQANWRTRIKLIAASVAAIFVASTVAGLILDAIAEKADALECRQFFHEEARQRHEHFLTTGEGSAVSTR